VQKKRKVVFKSASLGMDMVPLGLASYTAQVLHKDSVRVHAFGGELKLRPSKLESPIEKSPDTRISVWADPTNREGKFDAFR
jgi:hypothetical protein